MKVQLQERLGVPEGIIESAERFYNDLLEQVRYNIKKSNRKEEYYFVIEPKSPYQIGDEQVNRVLTNFIVTPNPNVENIDFAQMSTKSYLEPIEDKPGLGKTISKISGPIFSINLLVPEDYVPYDIIYYLVDNKKELVSSMAHEFKHVYDEHKKGVEKFEDRTKYIASREMMNFDIPALEYLGYYIYYTHLIEALVRPTETLAYLKQNKISKKDFVNFLKNIITFQTLKVINNFSMEKFRKELKKDYMNQIDEYLQKNFPAKSQDLSDDAKIDLVLAKWYEQFVTLDVSKYNDLLSNNFTDLFGLPENKLKALNRHVAKLTKFADNPQSYFEYIEKYLQKVSGETLKKIYKLYDLLEDEETPEYILQKKISDRAKK